MSNENMFKTAVHELVAGQQTFFVNNHCANRRIFNYDLNPALSPQGKKDAIASYTQLVARNAYTAIALEASTTEQMTSVHFFMEAITEALAKAPSNDAPAGWTVRQTGTTDCPDFGRKRKQYDTAQYPDLFQTPTIRRAAPCQSTACGRSVFDGDFCSNCGVVA